jgi:hypothetical protein
MPAIGTVPEIRRASTSNWPMLGMYQPDAIANYQVEGRTYLVTANEGDARDYDGLAVSRPSHSIRVCFRTQTLSVRTLR